MIALGKATNEFKGMLADALVPWLLETTRGLVDLLKAADGVKGAFMNADLFNDNTRQLAVLEDGEHGRLGERLPKNSSLDQPMTHVLSSSSLCAVTSARLSSESSLAIRRSRNVLNRLRNGGESGPRTSRITPSGSFVLGCLSSRKTEVASRSDRVILVMSV